MVVKAALQRWVAGLLRPWLQEEPFMEFDLGLFRCEGAFQDIKLNVAALNSAFMQSSKLLMHSATIGGVSIKILPWSRPAVTLRIYDVHVTLRPRPLDDQFWERSTQWDTDEQETKNALLCIDPQGAVLHAASERVMRIQSSSNWFVTFLTNMTLQCSRIVLCNTSIEVQIPEKGFPFPDIQDESAGGSIFYRCFLRAKHFSMDDGFFGHNKSPGGFLIAIISVLYSYRGAQGCKTCSVEDLGLELKRLDPLDFQPKEIDGKYVIFFKELMLSMKMKHLQLTDLEFGVPEVRLGLYPRDINELMRMLHQINYNAEKSAASAKYGQLAEKAKHGKSSRNLWQRSVENITRLKPGYRLQKLVETVILRLRYAKAYESWLLELRWGLKRGCIDVGSTKVKSKHFASCAEGLWKDVCEKENELPVEAVAQVRRVVRQRVLAQLKEDHTEVLDADLRGQKYSLPLSVVLAVISFLLQCPWKLLRSIYASVLYFFTALFNFIYCACPFLNKSFFPQPANENQTRVNRIQNFHDTKQCGYLFNVSQLCYTINIYKVFIDSACNAFNEKLARGKIEKGVAISSITGTYILFVLENLCLVYASDVNAMNFSVVCGDLNGQIFPAGSIESDLESSVHNRQRAYRSINDTFKRIFLRSSPAPQIHCLNKSRNGHGKVNVSSLSNAVFEKHQGQMWSDWENKVLKPNMPVGIALSTPTGKPFLLSEVESFVIDPSLRNPNSGLLRCDLALGELFFDLDCSSLMCLIVLLLQLVDSSEWKSFQGSKKSPHFLNCNASYTANRDEGWEELYDSYLGKMKQAMLSTVPEKNIHLTAAIAGPKIQLSTASEEYLKFEKQTTLAKNHTSFVLDLGNLEIAIWPAAQREALSLLQKQETDTSKLEQIWLKKLPILDHSRDFKSDFHMGHGQVGSNIYLKLEDAVVLLQNISGNKIPLVKPLTVTVESSVCRDHINSVLTTEKALLASLGCTSSAFALICSMDQLLFIIQIFEGYVKGMLDAFHEFPGRDARRLQERCRDANIHHSNNEYTGNSTKRSSSQQFDEVISPQFTSFAVVLTVDLETVDLLLEGSRGNLGDQNLKEVESGSENGKQHKISDEKCKHNDILRRIDLPNIDLKVSLESCNMKFYWGDSKQAQFSMRLSGFQVHVSDNTIETCKNSGNEVQQFKTRLVKEVSGAHTKIFTDLVFQSCTLKLYGGPHVYDKKIREENTRNRTGAGSSLKSQAVQESADSALPLECFNRHLDEFTPEFPQRRNIFEYNAVDLPLSSSSYWLVVDVDLSECLLTDCCLEMLISEAMNKLSGSKRLHALFTVGKDFESVSGKVQGGCLVLQMEPLAILIKSYRTYRLFLEHISSFFMSSIRKLKVRTSEVSGIAMIAEESNSYTTLRQAQRSLSFSLGSSRQSTSKAALHMQRSLSLPVSSSQERSQPIMHGVNTKKPFIEMLSLTVQQFSLVLAHADVSDGAQGVLLEMDFKTIIEIGHQKNKLSFDLSRLMMLGLHPIKKVTRGKEKADHIPHFGSTFPESISDVTQQALNRQLPFSATALSSRHVSKALNDHHLHKTLPGRVSSSSSYNYTGRDCYILECMTASFNIESVSAGAELGSRKHMDAWQGGCSISGVDLSFTTSEILMLLVLTSSFSELSTGNVVSSPQMTNYDYKQTEGAYSEPRIPNGAIVAVKDAQERLYLAVERIQNKYRLTGVLHYTLAGDKALFRVKYQDSRLWKNSQSWFSLLSVHARNDNGEPFCVHYRPGSALVDVSSTNDNAWELWRTIPFKHKAEDEEELDFHGNLYKKMVHLVNKKSGNGLAFVNGLPVLVRQPGNLLKLKIFLHDTLLKSIPPATPPLPNNASNEEGSLNMQLSYEKLAVMATILPQVNVVVEKLSITILYEASGFHFLPLLRACMNDAHCVLQVSSSKLRIISTLRIMVECYEASRNMWLEIVRPVEVSVVYRALGPTHDRGGVAFEKMPISFYSMLKRVDLSVSEPALDICLFLSGELNLAGPYTIKHSPVTANCCKIENCTGLNLLCSFDDKVDVKIAARKAESFLIRRMVSRRSLHLESSKNMTLQLVNSGTLSSIPVHISLEAPGVTVLRTNIMSRESQSKVSGSLIVVDVSKQNEDPFSVMVSPIVRIENASGLSLELRCRRPQQREDEGAVVLLKDGDNIDDSMGAFDASKFSGEVRKALLSLSVGNYVLCVRPATAEKSTVESETLSTFEWSEDLKGVKAVRVSGVFEKLSYHIKKKLGGQLMQSSFSTIHCGLKNSNTKFKDFYFLVRTTRRKLPLTRSHASESSIVAWHEQQDILILPTVRVSNLLEVDIAVTSSDCSVTNAVEISEGRVNAVIVQGGCKTRMYADLSKLFLTVTLCNLKQKSSPVNVGDWEKLSRNFKGDSRGLDVELDFGDGKRFAMMRLSRGDSGILEVIIYTPYALQNATDMKLICFTSNQKNSFLWGRKGKTTVESSPSGHRIFLHPESKICWFEKSEKILIQRSEQNAVVSLLDLEFFSGFTEISLEVNNETGKDIVKLGVVSQLSSSSVLEPTNIICLVPRYIVVNQSNEDIFVCQNGLQETRDAIMALSPGQRTMLHMKLLPGEDKAVHSVNNIFQMHRNARPDSALCVQFSLREHGWRWSGPVCAASLGSFFLKFRSCSNIYESSAVSVNTSVEKENTRFAVVDVKEEKSSLVLFFSTKSPESLPYQINNRLCDALIVFHQKESTETDNLKPGATVGYVWDDLTSAHELVVKVAGTQLWREINLDKLCPWKPFYKLRQIRGFSLSLPSGDGNIISDKLDLSKVGYEVYADGPTRILRLCEEIDSQKRRECTTRNQILYAKIDCNISYMGISLLEQVTQGFEDSNGSNCYTPIIVIRTGSLMLEFTIASKHMLCQFKVKTLEVDEKWQGAPFAAMLRVHGQDAFNREETALHMFAIVSNHASNPNQVKYSSILLKAIDLNLDEDTLMKLVPFYRTSLAETSSSREIYFENFEIQPIKIIANFLPGHPQANYTSAQETLRALLHSVIKVPTIKGATVELNGILLSHALVTFRQLALKCARHYSWYIMRAIYISKGSQLLPPAFASLFDDSASSSLHVFFDPSKGSINLQGFTIGMFNLLRKGDKMKGYFGTHRYIVDLERTMKTAGSNVLFAVITEVSDSVLKGVETSGFDGMVNGFRRGILKLAMEPSTLSTAFVKGSSTRRIKLDYSAGMNEIYIEGYLQAMLDTSFRQVYLKVRVIDDQVILKNLPPNSALIDEIIKCTKNFLIGEGLLASESSVAGYSLRRLQGDSEWKLGPQLKALCEQLFIVFAIRALRSQTQKMLGLGDSNTKSATAKESHKDQNKDVSSVSDSHQVKESSKQEKRSPSRALTNFLMSSAVAYIDGRLCRHIPNAIVRRIVSGFLLSFLE